MRLILLCNDFLFGKHLVVLLVTEATLGQYSPYIISCQHALVVSFHFFHAIL